MKTVRLENNVVVEVMPHKQFHADVLAKCMDAPDSVDLGWVLSSGTWLTPQPSPDHEIKSGQWSLKPEVAIREQAAAKVAAFVTLIAKPGTTVDQKVGGLLDLMFDPNINLAAEIVRLKAQQVKGN